MWARWYTGRLMLQNAHALPQAYSQPTAATPDPAAQQRMEELEAANTRLEADVAALQSQLARTYMQQQQQTVCVRCRGGGGGGLRSVRGLHAAHLPCAVHSAKAMTAASVQEPPRNKSKHQEAIRK